MISPTLARWRWAYLGSAMLKPAKSLITCRLFYSPRFFLVKMGIPAPLGKERMRQSTSSTVERVPVAMGTTSKLDVQVHLSILSLGELQWCHVSPHL